MSNGEVIRLPIAYAPNYGTVTVPDPTASIPDPGEPADNVAVPDPTAVTDAALYEALFAMDTSTGSASTEVLLLVRVTEVIVAALCVPDPGTLM
jgi:hypothetical protein